MVQLALTLVDWGRMLCTLQDMDGSVEIVITRHARAVRSCGTFLAAPPAPSAAASAAGTLLPVRLAMVWHEGAPSALLGLPPSTLASHLHGHGWLRALTQRLKPRWCEDSHQASLIPLSVKLYIQFLRFHP